MTEHSSVACFSFWLQLNMMFGPGTVRHVPAWMRERGHRRSAAVIDAAVMTHPLIAEICETLSGDLERFELCPNGVSEPDYDDLDAVAARLRGADLDSLIAVGGGSTIDLAKGASVLLTNPGRGLDYRGFDRVKNPGIPLVAVPTTAGTGSEVTPNAVFTDRREQRKLGINTPLYVPRLAILDPLLTVTCPFQVTLSSGMDALVHAVESYVAAAATPMSRVFSREAFRLIFNRLERVLREPDDVAARADMLSGAHYAGIGLLNSGAGPAGAMSYPLGVRFRVPHGLAGGVFLAPVARFNVARGSTIYADLYDLIENREAAATREEKSRQFCERLEVLQRAVGVPATLGPFGVSSAHVSMLAEETMLLGNAVAQNPVAMTTVEVTALLNAMVG